MSPYDDAEFTVHPEKGPLFCSIAAGLLFTASGGTKIQTSAATSDRILFLKKVKITGMKAFTRSGAAANAHALSMFAPKAKVMHGTLTVATAALGTVAGVQSIGGLKSANVELTSTDSLSIAYKVSAYSVGTHAIGTFAAQSFDVSLEYQNMF